MAQLRLQYVNSFRDRHGKARRYFRRPGRKALPLPGLPGSPEFMAAYQAALTGLTAPQKQIGEARTVAGTVQALVAAYLDCSAGSTSPFKTLAAETQRTRRNILENFREAVWALVDATQTETKFILSDHPVTVYNRDCFPASDWCRDFRDPDIRFVGTHTLFPLSPTRALVLTNHSWVRNPHVRATRVRPNPRLFRTAMFYFPGIQTGRELTEVEVNQINFIIKKRAYRYIAAADEEWLYPERHIPSEHWRKLDERYLLMPDPRSVTVSEEIILGYDNAPADIFDSYGRRPGQPGFKDETQAAQERQSHLAFQGEYARLFGPKRRGIGNDFGGREKIEDSPDFHQWHLSLERKSGRRK